VHTLKFQEWVPDWVRGEIIAALERSSLRPEMGNVLEQLVVSRDMRGAWEALERRQRQFAERFGSESVWAEHGLRPIESLGLTITTSLNEFDAMSTFTDAEVRAHAASIKKHSNALLAVMRAVGGHAQFSSLTSALAQAVASIDDSQAGSSDSEIRQLVSKLADGYLLARKLPDILLKLSDAASDLSRSGERIAMPRHPNAKRLQLLCTLRRYFEAAYGMPLHGVNLAVASTFFECQSLNEANVAELTRGHRLQGSPADTRDVLKFIVISRELDRLRLGDHATDIARVQSDV